jgi:hypothetical protein
MFKDERMLQTLKIFVKEVEEGKHAAFAVVGLADQGGSFQLFHTEESIHVPALVGALVLAESVLIDHMKEPR